MIKLTLSLLFLATTAIADSSLLMAGASFTRSSHGTLGAMDMNPSTVIIWIFPTTLTDNRNFWGKNHGTTAFERCDGKSRTNLFSVGYTGTVALRYDSATPTLTTNKWWYIGATIDLGLGAGQKVKFYIGDSTTTASLQTATVVAEGSGYNSMTTYPFAAGASVDNQAFPSNIGFIAVWNRALTAAEVIDQQYAPHVTSGCKLFSYLGFNGTGTQFDLSGNASNGTVTAATASSLGPPIFIQGRSL